MRPVEDPIDVLDDAVRLRRAQLPGLGELPMADEEGLPAMLVPGLDPVEDRAVVFLGPAPKDPVPLRLVPESSSLLQATLVLVPERVSERFDADSQLEPSGWWDSGRPLRLGLNRRPLGHVARPGERSDGQHRETGQDEGTAPTGVPDHRGLQWRAAPLTLPTGSLPAGGLIKLDIPGLFFLGGRLRVFGFRLGRIFVVEDRLDQQSAERRQVAFVFDPRELLEGGEQLLLAPLRGQHLP